MTTRAHVETKNAPLHSDFGREYLFRKFDAEIAEFILATFGTFQKGKNAGKQRGYIVWEKCISGGWRRKDGVGFVQKPGSSLDVRVSLVFGGEGCSAIYADKCKWTAAPVSEELADACKAKGIDPNKYSEESRVAHAEFVKRYVAEAHKAGKEKQAAAFAPRRY